MSIDELFKLHAAGLEWFKTHANQRMQLVNYWFVAMSFLTTAVVLAFAARSFGAALVVSGCIAFASLVFLFLDMRTRELISYGESLMEATELELFKASKLVETKMVVNMHSSKRRRTSYRVLFTLLYSGAGLLGLFGAIFALLRLLGH